jgi:hypothetical protein
MHNCGELGTRYQVLEAIRNEPSAYLQIPQGLKPKIYVVIDGVAEATPFRNHS